VAHGADYVDHFLGRLRESVGAQLDERGLCRHGSDARVIVRRWKSVRSSRRIDNHVRDYSGLIPACRTTLPHFAISDLRNAVNSAEDIGCASIAWRANWSRTSGRARMRVSSRLNLSTTSRGVRDGTSSVYHDCASTPVTPLSIIVGTS